MGGRARGWQARLPPEEESRLALLERSLLDLQASDRNTVTRQLARRAEHLEALGRHFEAVEAALSSEAPDSALNARADCRQNSAAANKLQKDVFEART